MSGDWFTGSSLSAICREIEIAERQKRKIERIARQAEAAQRFAKGGHWK